MSKPSSANSLFVSPLFQCSLSQEQFLKEYWNKKPLLIKGGLPVAQELARLEDFLELAMDEDFETRVVYKDERGKRKMLHGPFAPSELQRHRQSPFALICHNLNDLEPNFYEMEKAVSFIPKWEFDDVMSVYSTKEMSLGAHIDNYNVFIVQGQGKRRWEIQERPQVSWRADEEIKVLEDFHPDYAWELDPGDIIYIPPGVAHHGISLEESISYSIGFKSLETVDLLGQWLAHLKTSDAPSNFYRNPSFNHRSAGDLEPGLVDFLADDLRAQLESKDFKTWLVQTLAAPKFSIASPREKALDSYQGIELQRDAQLKYALLPDGEDWLLGLNQWSWRLDQEQLELLLPILDSNPFETFCVSARQEEVLRERLNALYERGCIFIPADEFEESES